MRELLIKAMHEAAVSDLRRPTERRAILNRRVTNSPVCNYDKRSGADRRTTQRRALLSKPERDMLFS